MLLLHQLALVAIVLGVGIDGYYERLSFEPPDAMGLLHQALWEPMLVYSSRIASHGDMGHVLLDLGELPIAPIRRASHVSD